MFAAAPVSCTYSATLLLPAGSTTWLQNELFPEAHQREPVPRARLPCTPASVAEDSAEAQSLGQHSGEKIVCVNSAFAKKSVTEIFGQPASAVRILDEFQRPPFAQSSGLTAAPK